MTDGHQTLTKEWDQIREAFFQRRHNPSFHLGLGDIRLTMADQLAIAAIVEDLQRYSTHEPCEIPAQSANGGLSLRGESIAAQGSAPHSADHLQRFTDWLVKEMPAGTVIGDPAWWARKLLAGACVFADEAPEGIDAAIEDVRGLKLPCDVRIGAGTFMRGVPVGTMLMSLRNHIGYAQKPGYPFTDGYIDRAAQPPGVAALKDLLLPIELEHLIEWHRMLVGCAEQTDQFAAARRSRERHRELVGLRDGSSPTKEVGHG